jgi:hypothetical protein
MFNALNKLVLRRGFADALALGVKPKGNYIPILMTAYGRPQYLRRVLAALSNVSHIHEVCFRAVVQEVSVFFQHRT